MESLIQFVTFLITQIVKILDIIIWPIFMSFSLFIFRKDISGLFDRLKSFGAGNAKMDFYADVKRFGENLHYDSRLTRQQAKDESVKDEIKEVKIIHKKLVRTTQVSIMRGDITKASTDIIVSSDDNQLSASGGVAKAILSAGGTGVLKRIIELREEKIKQGDVVITGGGALYCKAIFHAVLIDKETFTYPNTTIVGNIVKKCLDLAQDLNFNSLAFPILGGGTAAAEMTTEQSYLTIVKTIMAYLQQNESELKLNTIQVFIFDSNAVAGVQDDVAQIFR